MVESMIERAARAIVENPPEERQESTPDGWRIIRDFERTARAAIEAMRELNDVMADTACDIVVGWDDFATGDGNIYLGIPGYPQKAQGVWGQMIDAALNEQVAG